MKPIYTIILLLMFSLTSNSQDYRHNIGLKILPGLTKGATVGLKHQGEKFDSLRIARGNINAGMSYIYNINEFMSIESGIYYTNRGGIIKNVYKSLTIENQFIVGNFDIYCYDYYITFPLLFRSNFNSFYTSVGPTFGYNFLRESITQPYSHVESNNWQQYPFIYNFSLGIDLNIGAKIKISDRTNINLEASYEFSNLKFDKPNRPYYYNNFEFGIGFNYSFKKKDK